MTRVLVVEDEDSFSDAISYLLRKEGFEVAVCATGPDALETFDRTGADLVLLDLMLPGLPGSEVCRSLREKSNVPVIMLTAKDSEIDKVVGLELGADDYVTKPFSSRELVARMRAVLRRRGDADEVAETALESGPGPDGRGPARGHRPGRHGAAPAEGVRAAPGAAAQRRPGADPDAAASTGSGAPTTWATPRRWTCTSSGSGPRSSADPARPQHIVTVRGLGYKFESAA